MSLPRALTPIEDAAARVVRVYESVRRDGLWDINDLNEALEVLVATFHASKKEFRQCRAQTMGGPRCRKEALIESGLCGQHTVLHAHGRSLFWTEEETVFPT